MMSDPTVIVNDDDGPNRQLYDRTIIDSLWNCSYSYGSVQLDRCQHSNLKSRSRYCP